MKIAFLPHYFKTVAYGLIVASFIFGGWSEAIRGFNDGTSGIPPSNTLTPLKLTDYLLYAAMFVYILSKEKWDDEYIALKRRKAFAIALWTTTLIFLGIKLFGIHTINIDLALFTQFFIYIITFKVLKMDSNQALT